MPCCTCSACSAALSASSASAAAHTGSDASYAHRSWGRDTAYKWQQHCMMDRVGDRACPAVFAVSAVSHVGSDASNAHRSCSHGRDTTNSAAAAVTTPATHKDAESDHWYQRVFDQRAACWHPAQATSRRSVWGSK